MGLDMYLKASCYVSGWDHGTSLEKTAFKALLKAGGLTAKDVCENLPAGDISITVAYWRKANQIHAWFVKNVQKGIDNCESFIVDREQLTQLRDVCKEVLSNPDKASTLLPPQAGFFFGQTDASSDWYK